jgi:hypothetical protein
MRINLEKNSLRDKIPNFDLIQPEGISLILIEINE